MDVEQEGGILEALNKIDLLSPPARAAVVARTARDPHAVALSAATGEGMPALMAALDELLAVRRRVFEYRLGPAEGAAIAWLYDHGEVLERTDDEGGVAHLTVGLDAEDAARFESRHRRATDAEA